MYVIGFQEIVKLTARQIAVTDENKRRIWEREIEKTINRRGGSRFIQLRSVQLVGTALMIYVKEQNVAFIRNVECTMKKVNGLSDMHGDTKCSVQSFEGYINIPNLSSIVRLVFRLVYEAWQGTRGL